ncbi:hypothetical protein [Verminephrobacter eiseniae]|uniref:hypothetical protein n=1 Tax=Verminephrobacter eiseniae TaxID=364317 RepID=UPI002237E95E|nr:hypothetical protein [Verminephrobacter eiseniae]
MYGNYQNTAANGSGAAANAAGWGSNGVTAGISTVNGALGTGNFTIGRGSTAHAMADLIHRESANTGVTASARTEVQLQFTVAGACTFQLRSDNAPSGAALGQAILQADGSFVGNAAVLTIISGVSIDAVGNASVSGCVVLDADKSFSTAITTTNVFDATASADSASSLQEVAGLDITTFKKSDRGPENRGCRAGLYQQPAGHARRAAVAL